MTPASSPDPSSAGCGRRGGFALFAVGLVATAALCASLFVSFLYLRSTERYKATLQFAGARWAPGLSIVLGDSIIQSVGDRDERIANFAVAGGTIASTGERAFEILRNRAATRAILSVGINDLRFGRSPDAFADALISMIRRLRAETTLRQVLVVSVLPVVDGAPAASMATNAAIDAFNLRLLQAARRGEIEFVDISALFRDASGLRPDLTYDGLHLNDAGRARLQAIVWGLAHS